MTGVTGAGQLLATRVRAGGGGPSAIMIFAGFKNPNLVSLPTARPLSPIRCFAMRRGTPEGLARQPLNQGTKMHFRARVAASAALVTAGFLLAPAVAQASSHPVVNRVKKLR